MTHTAYIVRISLADADFDAPTPDAWYKPKVNGEFIPAGHSPAGRPRWFTSADAAVAAVHEALQNAGVPDMTRVVWEPQYDSSWAEALDEPCGYVARIS